MLHAYIRTYALVLLFTKITHFAGSVPLNQACMYSLIAIATGIRFSAIVPVALKKFDADIVNGVSEAIQCSKDKFDSLRKYEFSLSSNSFKM